MDNQQIKTLQLSEKNSLQPLQTSQQRLEGETMDTRE